jgi:hypothetical protein
MMSLGFAKKKTSPDVLAALAQMGGPSDASILRQTVKTTVAMVAACVLFVGLLSILAVVAVGKAVGTSSGSASGAVDTPSTSQPGHAKSAHQI